MGLFGKAKEYKDVEQLIQDFKSKHPSARLDSADDATIRDYTEMARQVIRKMHRYEGLYFAPGKRPTNEAEAVCDNSLVFENMKDYTLLMGAYALRGSNGPKALFIVRDNLLKFNRKFGESGQRILLFPRWVELNMGAERLQDEWADFLSWAMSLVPDEI